MPSKPEVQRVKMAGVAYAKNFLAQKYHTEYRELYEAYLLNRGITPHQSPNRVLVDEREILKSKEGGN